MNHFSLGSVFVTTAALVALGSALTVVVVAFCARRTAEPRQRGHLWRAALVAIAVLAIGEITGAFHAGGAWLRHHLRFAETQTVAAKPLKAPASESAQALPVHVEGEIPPRELADNAIPENDVLVSDPLVEEAMREAALVLAALPEDDEVIDAEMTKSAAPNKAPTVVHSPPTTGPRISQPSQPTLAWRRWAALAWGAVGGFFALRLLGARVAWQWRYRHARRVTDKQLRHCVGVLARELGLRRRVEIWSSPLWNSPVAWGMFRPSVGLPADFQESFTRAEQDAMLAHELGHLASRDPAWQCLADAVTALLWWAPWCWWLRKQMRIAAEWMADEASLLVADGPQALAECLVMLGRRMTREHGAAYSVTGNFRSNLGKRVERLLELADSTGGNTPRGTVSRWRMPAMVACVALGMIATSAWARPNSELNQGAENMRWFEQSWRRSLAGGIVSLALGAPTSAVLAQDDDDAAEVAAGVEVAGEEEAGPEEDEAEEADEAEDDSDEAAEEAEDASEEAVEEAEQAMEEVTEEVNSIAEEVAEELEGALAEVGEDVEEVLADVEVDVEAVLADSDVDLEEALADVEMEIEVAVNDDAREEADDDSNDDGDDDDEHAAHAQAEREAAVKAKLEEVLKQRQAALEKMQGKLQEGLSKRHEKARKVEDKARGAREKAAQKLAEAREKANQKLADAKERGDKNAPEIEKQLQDQLEELQRRIAAEEAMIQAREKEVQDQLLEAERSLQNQMMEKQRAIEAELEARMQDLRKHDHDLAAQVDKERAIKRDGRQGKGDSARQRQEALDQLLRTAAVLRNDGNNDAAEQIESIAKLLHDRNADEEASSKDRALKVYRDKVQAGEKRGELEGRVNDLQSEVQSLRSEIAELRDLLKQSLSKGGDAPPKP